MTLLPRTYIRLVGALVAALVMGAGVAWLAVELKFLLHASRDFALKSTILLFICAAGIVVYLGVARLFGAYDLAFLGFGTKKLPD